MTVKELTEKMGLKAACMPVPEREISGAYIGDLLSWVMGRAGADCAWITIMSNLNIVAVASLADVACVILAEGVTPDGAALDAARERGVNLLLSEAATYETAVALSHLIK